MKRIITVFFIVCLIGALLVACGRKSDSKSKDKDNRSFFMPILNFDEIPSRSIPTAILDQNVFNVRYHSSPFSISIGELVNYAMKNYKITYLTCKEAISQGYLTEDQIDSEVNRDKFYFAIISGETMVNPNIPYMLEEEKEAAVVWMIFTDDNQLANSGVDLCENLETCAIILMTSSY